MQPNKNQDKVHTSDILMYIMLKMGIQSVLKSTGAVKYKIQYYKVRYSITSIRKIVMFINSVVHRDESKQAD